MNQYYRIMSSSHYVIVMHSDGSGNNGGDFQVNFQENFWENFLAVHCKT